MKPCPTWLDKSQWKKVPEKLLIREVSFRVTVRGFKTKRITLATTLFDQRQYPKGDLAQLYRRRWMAELYLRDIKTTLGMDLDIHLQDDRNSPRENLIVTTDPSGPFLASLSELGPLYPSPPGP